MKIDSEPKFANSTLTKGPDCQIFKYDENAVDTGRSRVNNEIVVEDIKGFTPILKFEKWDLDTDSLPPKEKLAAGIMNMSGFDGLVDMEDSINDEDKKIGEPLNPVPISANEDELYEKEREFYTDKSVTECDLPELMVCFKDDDYHVVKDICIDDGLPSLDKILVENNEVDDNGDFSTQHSNFEVNSELKEEIVDGRKSISNWRNPFVDDYDCETDVVKQFDSARLIQNGEQHFVDILNASEKVMPESSKLTQQLDADDSLDNILDEKVLPEALAPELEVGDCLDDVSDERITPETIQLSQESDISNSLDDVSDEKAKPETLSRDAKSNVGNSVESLKFEEEEDQQKSEQVSCTLVNDHLAPQDTSKETNSTNSTIPTTAEQSNNCDQVDEASFDSKVESGSITYDFDSSQPATSGREKDPKVTDSQQPVQTLNILWTEEDKSDSQTASGRSFFIQHGHGESSSAGPLSGPIPYSGSISLRSDSSTTSTRSFAFPVLNSEWNSSPVKMAKADRRHLRKHQGWMMSFLCCRF